MGVKKTLGLFVASALVPTHLIFTQQVEAPKIVHTGPDQEHIVFAVGLYPLRDSNVGWQPTFCVSAGYGRAVSEDVSVSGYVEYLAYRMDEEHLGESWTPRLAKRHDVALYLNSDFWGFLSLGIGAYYTTSDAVVIGRYPDFAPRERWPYSGKDEVSLLCTAGLSYAFPLTGTVSLPVGIHYRHLGNGSEAVPLFLRTGIKLKL